MARRRSSRQRMRTPKRGYHIPTANHRLLRVSLPRLDLRLLEDRRLYDPGRHLALPRRERRGGSVPSRLAERGRFPAQLRLGFDVPKRVALCVRRKKRREVLFATRGTGKGARSPKHRNDWSNVKC